jgi:hypothetical protein
MKEKGLINNIYDEITPEALKKLRIETTFSKTPNFLEGTRLLKMTAPWKYGELSKIMNKAPALAAPIVAKELIEKKEFGGKILDTKIIGNQKMYLIEE